MAVAKDPAHNFALISVPGDYAAAEAMKALRLGMDVMLFSDNVPPESELALKQYAREHDLMVMGPDCGTAIVNGVPLGFANVDPARTDRRRWRLRGPEPRKSPSESISLAQACRRRSARVAMTCRISSAASPCCTASPRSMRIPRQA